MATNFQDQTPKQYIRSVQLVHLALLLGLVGFAVAIYIINPSNKIDFSESGLFLYIVPLIMILGIVLGNFIFKKLITRTFKQNSLKTKLDNFLSAAIIKFALIEGPSLLALVAYLLSGNLLYIILASVLMVYLYMQRPTKTSVSETLKLSGELKNQFDKENENVT